MEDSMCRACLLQKRNAAGEFADLFSSYSNGDMQDSILLSDMLTSCSNTKVLNNDDLPKCICPECQSTLIIAYKFKIHCENSYKWLLENYPVSEVKVEENVKCENLESEFKIESPCTLDIKDEPNEAIENDNDLICDNFNLYNFENCESPKPAIAICENQIKIGNSRLRKYKRKQKVKTKVKLKKCQRPKTLKCNQCPKMFTWECKLRAHMHVHTGSKSYFCPICKKFYKSKIQHIKGHQNKFTCDICSKCFPTKAKVRIHLETHLADRKKNFHCNVPGCDKVYLSVQGLNRHKLIHSGKKDFLCHLCSKAFIDKAGLSFHMSFHFNEKNYKCRTCGKHFYTTSNRNYHELSHSEKRFSCAQCGSRFISRAILKRHTSSHTNELHNKCTFCPKRFAREDNRKRHELVIHGFGPNIVKSIIIDQPSKDCTSK